MQIRTLYERDKTARTLIPTIKLMIDHLQFLGSYQSGTVILITISVISLESIMRSRVRYHQVLSNSDYTASVISQSKQAYS